MKIPCAVLILSIFCEACADNEPVPVVHSVDASAGGGFTGGYGGVSLNANGQVTTFSGGPNMPFRTVLVKTIDPAVVKRLISLAIELRSYKYNDMGTGDWHYSLKIHAESGDHYITWSPGSTKLDPRVLKLYKGLGQLLK